MAGTYELWLTDDYGRRITDSRGKSYLKSFLQLTATRAVNEIGQFTLNVPASFDESLLREDRMVQVWRAPTGGRLGLWRAYFIRDWEFAMDEDGAESIEISGPDQNDLLNRRIVAAYSGTTYASKADYADDMMKEVVSESQAASGDLAVDAGSRAWASFSVAADLSDGPLITKTFPFHYLLTQSGEGALAIIANAARAAGTEIFFDVVPNVVSGSSITFQFRTYTGQPGQDVSSRVVFSKENGNLKTPRLRWASAGERNYFYAAGQGEGPARTVRQVYDASRYNASQWNRREGFADARNESDSDAVQAAGRAALTEARPRYIFSGVPVDTVGTRFGRDWDFGYRVSVKYRNYEAEHIIRAVTLSVDSSGRESIQTRLDDDTAVS